jgi:hypothetical protein
LKAAREKPLEGTKVGVLFDGFFRGVAKDQWTNTDGEATFTERNGRGTVFVEGTEVYEGELEGKKMIYL